VIADGFGAGSRSHFRSEVSALTRSGRTPDRRYAAMAPSTQALPNSDPACVVPPTPSISADRGNRLRTSRLPVNGVAASSVSLISRIGGAFAPVTVTGVPAFAPQVRHGALYQALPQLSNGARRWIRQLSFRHLVQDNGHCTSVHCTAR
jgi:hypothetical protein